MKMKKRCFLLPLVVAIGLVWPSGIFAQYVNDVWLYGETPDMTPPSAGSGAYINRLGGFGSSIWYDQASSTMYALPDAGPGGGLTPFESRMHKFSLDVDPVTGGAEQLCPAGYDAVYEQ